MFFNNLFCAKKLHQAVVSAHCVMVAMAILQRVRPIDEEAEMSFFGFDLPMRENVYKRGMLPLPDALSRSEFEGGKKSGV